MKVPRCRPRRPLVLPMVCALLTACDGDVVEPPVTAVPSSVQVVAGDSQRAVQGLSLPDRVAVRVINALGQPVSGHAVNFTPAPGHGDAEPASATTDDDGRASTAWTLGTDPGQQSLRVAAANAVTDVGATALDLEAELELLFAPPSRSEMESVREDWGVRSAPAADVRVELSEGYYVGRTEAGLRIVSHVVTGARHYGAIVTPSGAEAESLPVLVYLHGGDNGVFMDELQILAFGLGDLTDRFVYVVPSYRSEPLRHGGAQWVSDGVSSPWDYDVDDVIALVNVAFETTPEAKPGSYGIIGISRGGGVALLAGIRDERVERIVTFFGPTDFFDSWVRDIVREAALRMPRSLPGVIHLDSTVVQPYIRGEVTVPEARLELVRRSPVLFAAQIPRLQVHHGSIDFVVPVSQAESLMRAMDALGRGPPDFEAHIYGSGGHDVSTLEEAIPRATAFLAGALGTGTAPIATPPPAR